MLFKVQLLHQQNVLGYAALTNNPQSQWFSTKQGIFLTHLCDVSWYMSLVITGTQKQADGTPLSRQYFLITKIGKASAVYHTLTFRVSVWK